MSGIEKVPLPRAPSGQATWEQIVPWMSTIVRDMLRIADVRNAVGANGIQITGTPNSVGIVGLETTVRDRIFDRRDTYIIPDIPVPSDRDRIIAQRMFAPR